MDFQEAFFVELWGLCFIDFVDILTPACTLNVPAQVFEENAKDQCQEHIAHDLTHSWPRPGVFLQQKSLTMLFELASIANVPKNGRGK